MYYQKIHIFCNVHRNWEIFVKLVKYFDIIFPLYFQSFVDIFSPEVSKKLLLYYSVSNFSKREFRNIYKLFTKISINIECFKNDITQCISLNSFNVPPSKLMGAPKCYATK